MIDVKPNILVEAGGVEPPSEKARNEENYVRIRLMVFVSHHWTGKNGGCLARLSLSRQLRTEALGLSCKMTFADHRAGSVAGTAT